MKAEIIAVGTELLLGQIANTNAQFLSQKLAEIGVDVYYHTVVGDNGKRMAEVFHTARSRSDLIIITGGLGPTEDDITKETLASLLGLTLELDAETWRRIKAFFKQRGIPMSDNNRKQAEVIRGSEVFPNNNGLAAGMLTENNGRLFMLLPGPPSELKPMFVQYAIPALRSRLNDQHIVYSKTLRFFGIGEARLDDRLRDLLRNQLNPTIAPLASDGEVSLRLTAKADSEQQAIDLISEVEQKIRHRVGRWIYGFNEDTLPGIVVRHLSEARETVSTAESCTGGWIGQMITSVPGSSSVFKGAIVSYANEVKRDLLQVPADIIETYGAVSKQTAEQMAERIRKLTGTTYGISVTGVAGPDEQEGKKAGTVWIGLADGKTTETYPLQLAGGRDTIRLMAAKYALFYLWQKGKKGETIA